MSCLSVFQNLHRYTFVFVCFFCLVSEKGNEGDYCCGFQSNFKKEAAHTYVVGRQPLETIKEEATFYLSFVYIFLLCLNKYKDGWFRLAKYFLRLFLSSSGNHTRKMSILLSILSFPCIIGVSYFKEKFWKQGKVCLLKSDKMRGCRGVHHENIMQLDILVLVLSIHFLFLEVSETKLLRCNTRCGSIEI